MKAVCLVAHPDDCVIFGWGFIRKYQHFDWKIVYLTYNFFDERAIEMKNFWDKYGIETQFGGFTDDWELVKNNELGFDGEDAQKFLQYHCSQHDIVLTHNHLGEYGHLHHKFINESITHIAKPKVYFGNFPQYYNEIIHTEPYNVHELPLHKDVILGFDNSTFKYYITDEAKSLLNERIT
jgi:hypothetical protein